MRFLRAMVMAAGLLACSTSDAGGGQPPLPTVVLQVGATPVTAEVADSPEERELGLMFRERLAAEAVPPALLWR